MSMSLIPGITGSKSSTPQVTYITQWGTTGSGNGQFSGSYWIAVNASGYVYVADSYGNNRIQALTPPVRM